MRIPEITEAAIRAAIREFDELGRTAFLKKYGFGPSRGYYLVWDGKLYDSKAIVGAAHGYVGPDYQPLLPGDFSGGEQTVARSLRQLGFDMQTPNEAMHVRVLPFVPGRTYHRQRDIHQVFGGQERGGISTPRNGSLIFLFTGESGTRYGYQDGPLDDGTFLYTGEGQQGNMEVRGNNRAVKDHIAEGRDLLLFEANPSKKGFYRFLGCYDCTGYEYRAGIDGDRQTRQLVVFRLAPIDVVDAAQEPEPNPGDATSNLEELRRQAYDAVASPSAKKPMDGTRTYYQRSAAVRTYVLSRAKGVCESCKTEAPFKRYDGSPYLEPHHIRRVSDGGPDHPRWVGAICPNCHRRIHHGTDGDALNATLMAYVATIEGEQE